MKQKQLGNNEWHGISNLPVSFENEKTGKKFKNGFISRILFKSTVLLAVFLMGTGISQAQFQWGIKFGVNASTQSEVGNICDNSDLIVGLNAGVTGKYQLNNWIAIKSVIDFQQKGMMCDSKEFNSDVRNKLSYLILPVKAEFSASEKAGLKNGRRLIFAGGPYLGYLIDSKQIINNQTTDLKDLAEFDYGWSFELGFEYPVFESKAIQISLNYDMGLANLVEDVDIQNKSASLNLGFLF